MLVRASNYGTKTHLNREIEDGVWALLGAAHTVRT